MMMKIIINLIK